MPRIDFPRNKATSLKMPKLRINFICLVFLLGLIDGRVIAEEGGLGLPTATGDRPNVLMILVDDLKPALGCYGDKLAKTPNLDALSRRGMRFDLAYCNQAVCAPSRFSLMLGSHSTSSGLYGLGSQLREIVPDAITCCSNNTLIKKATPLAIRANSHTRRERVKNRHNGAARSGTITCKIGK